MVRVLLLAVVLLFFAADASAYKKNYSEKKGTDIEWLKSKQYKKGALVWTSASNWWVAQVENKGEQYYPETTAFDGVWKKVGLWRSTNAYHPGDVVIFMNRIYRAPSNHDPKSRKRPSRKRWNLLKISM